MNGFTGCIRHSKWSIRGANVDHIAGVASLADGTGAGVWAPSEEVDALRAGKTRGGFDVVHIAMYSPRRF